MSGVDPLELHESVHKNKNESRENDEQRGDDAYEELARNRRIKIIQNYQKLDPPKYVGIEGPEAAEEFLQRAEKIFTLIGATNEEKVLLATYTLHKKADSRWQASKGNIRRCFGGN